jgi:hypothetical protein
LRILNRILDVVLFQMLAATIQRRSRDFQHTLKPTVPAGRARPLLFVDERQIRFVAFVFHSFYWNEMEGR